LKYKIPISRIAAAYGALASLFCCRRSDRQLPGTAANLGAQQWIMLINKCCDSAY
jgi:hypothetical protein